MLTSLSHSFIYVLDHDEAVDFYVGKLGLEVGFTSLGSFSRTFSHVIGMSPTAYREAWRTGAATAGYVPTCVVMAWTRPSGSPHGSSFGEADRDGAP